MKPTLAIRPHLQERLILLGYKIATQEGLRAPKQEYGSFLKTIPIDRKKFARICKHNPRYTPVLNNVKAGKSLILINVSLN